jgi:hypothetical protein
MLWASMIRGSSPPSRNTNMTRRWMWGSLSAGLLAAFGIGWWTGAANAQQASAMRVY